jgi:hypothetical protein
MSSRNNNYCGTAVNLRYGENNVNVGPLKEIPEICIDHFFGKDLKSTAFFLSHAHTGNNNSVIAFLMIETR